MPGLTIERTENQSVIIGDSITVTVQKARNGRVKLNVVAPQDFKILRTEILERKENKNELRPDGLIVGRKAAS